MIFKKFSSKDPIAQHQVKSSIARGIRNSIIESYPSIEPYIDDIMPKKANVIVGKTGPAFEEAQLVIIDNVILFFQFDNGPFIPTLRLLHQYPMILPQMRVDKGAIKFLIGGANVMCPGLTHPNATMDNVEVGKAVAIMAEGKEHALAVGITTMSTEEIRKINKGICITIQHYLNDGLWKTEKLD